jgi:predicted acylesterase/phospholipase RssA
VGPQEHRETNIFVCESTAYRRLKETGRCKRGVAPDFYGTITNIQSKNWPEFHKFHKDELPANAILMEYIPNMQRIHLGNRTRERMEILRDILIEIHAVHVLHDDGYPRNMGVCPATDMTTGRLLWFDFDRAQTYPVDQTIPEWPAEWVRKS